MSVLTLAFALISSVSDLARVFVAPAPAPAPITFNFINRHEEQSFALLDDAGAARPDAVAALSHFVRCWRTEREKPMHPRLVEIVAAVNQHFGTSQVDVVSGYRARPYGAPHSKHFLGHAMDLQIPGVPAKKVAAYVWENFRHIGVGYYPKQQFVHVDVRPDDVRWVDLSRHGESARARYFARPASEQLPVDAPKLAYDAPAPRLPDGPVHLTLASLSPL
jgi:uncharacterized protein YcbK (DUF882 family)